jgi:hypothetical protein
MPRSGRADSLDDQREETSRGRQDSSVPADSTVSVGRGDGDGAAQRQLPGADFRSPNPQEPIRARRPYREPDRERPYSLRDSEVGTLVEIGTFRAVDLDDLTRHRYAGHGEQSRRDLDNLGRQGLIRFRTTYPEHAVYVTLTRAGHRFIEHHRPIDLNARQALYNGFVKPREAKHDAGIYRLYQHEAERIQAEGGKIGRVILDFELKKTINRQVGKLASLPESEQTRHRQEIAGQHGLTVVNGRIPIPDLQVEYETSEREQARVNLELASPLPPGRPGGQGPRWLRDVCASRGCRPAPPCATRFRINARDFVAMNIARQHLDAVRELGYTDTEASFLYLVATHFGYFTQQQFLNFAQVQKGGMARRLTAKALQLKHVRAAKGSYHTYVYNLYSRRLYGEIDKENLRNRRHHSKELIQTRLLILDFVLAHRDERYLETEAEKVAYFHDTLGLSLAVLPGRIYKGIKSTSNTKRYFVDRFPVLLPRPKNSLSVPPLVTLAYCDGASSSLAGYVTHLRAYEKFLRRLPAFNFVYAAPNPSKFHRAAAFFARLFGNGGDLDARHLVRYFQLRLLWETNRASMLSRADQDFLRAGDKRYHGELFDSAYRKWASKGLSDPDIDTLLGPAPSRPKRSFQTYVLPHTFSVFDRFSKDHTAAESGTIFPGAGSAHGSTDGSTLCES